MLKLFARKKPALTREQSLATRPVRLVDGDLIESKDGAKLKVKLKQTRLAGFLLRLPEGATKTFELDALGLLVWKSCDGKTSVKQIVRQLARQYNLNLREAEVPTLAFLRM